MLRVAPAHAWSRLGTQLKGFPTDSEFSKDGCLSTCLVCAAVAGLLVLLLHPGLARQLSTGMRCRVASPTPVTPVFLISQQASRLERSGKFLLPWVQLCRPFIDLIEVRTPHRGERYGLDDQQAKSEKYENRICSGVAGSPDVPECR